MINIIEKISVHTIKVDNGSGVLIQPSDADYSYVLTAKHVIVNDQNVVNLDKIEASTLDNVKINIASCVFDEHIDLAILITSERLDSSLMKCIDDMQRSDNVIVVGYPKTRRELEGQTREFSGTVDKISGDELVIELNGFPGHDQLEGVSGGGVYKEINGDIFLCGILSGLQGNPAAEHHGKVKCISLSSIDKLIEQYELKQLLPVFLTCFSHSVLPSFKLDRVGSEDNVVFTRHALHQLANDFRGKNLPSPMQVLAMFEDQLLVNNSPKQDVHHRDMWTAFLEFVVISAIVDSCSEVTFEYLAESAGQRKFLFTANKGNWQALLIDVFKSDLRGLKKGGVIVVSTGEYNGKPQISDNTLERLVTNITRRDYKQLKIDSAIKNPVREFRLHHLAGLHDLCIEEKEDDYAKYGYGIEGFEEKELIEKLRSEYHAFIGK